MTQYGANLPLFRRCCATECRPIFGAPIGAPVFCLAATAVVVAATAAAVVVIGIGAAAQAVVAAAAEQQDEDDDPPAAITTETVIAHNKYLQDFFSGGFAAHSKIFRSPKKVRNQN